MKSLCHIAFLLCGLLVVPPTYGQSPAAEKAETRMAELQTLLAMAPTDEARLAASDELADICRKLIRQKEAFDYPFALLHKVNTLTSPDGAFRIFNWNIPLTDGTYRYRLLVWPKGAKKSLEAGDNAELEREDRRTTIDADRWYGALYYEVHPVKVDGRTVYTVLGWDGHDAVSTKKVLDVLVLDGKNDLSFGYPIFETESGDFVHRRVFEYADDAVMNLKWVEAKDAIVFDKLEPRLGGAKGNYAYYGPGTGYAGYRLEDGRWRLVETMDMSRPQNRRNDARFNFPDRPDFSRQRDTINPLIGR